MDRGQEEERGRDQIRAGRERRHALADDISKAELVLERLRGVEEVVGTYPRGHKMRARLDNLHLERTIEEVERELQELYDRTAHPRGT